VAPLQAGGATSIDAPAGRPGGSRARAPDLHPCPSGPRSRALCRAHPGDAQQSRLLAGPSVEIGIVQWRAHAHGLCRGACGDSRHRARLSRPRRGSVPVWPCRSPGGDRTVNIALYGTLCQVPEYRYAGNRAAYSCGSNFSDRELMQEEKPGTDHGFLLLHSQHAFHQRTITVTVYSMHRMRNSK
jgi:hypothetical protein